ncbi:MAG: 4Fe-4S dicluster domain-containing protein [Oscillospiraceae bacterium]|nr:4Fe-4S dicluster domain-containing protein [Oscillospiraceae bacterium]
MKWNLEFERCKGCALCTTVCPKKIVIMQDKKLNKSGYYTSEITDMNACTSCALCAVMCPDCAIIIEN